jgi:hypothetical protein
MSTQTAMFGLCLLEFALWAVFALLFWMRKLHRRFPMTGAYLGLRLASMPPLLFFLYGQSQHWLNGRCFDFYLYTHWAVFIARSVLLYFICLEVFRFALSAFPGLLKIGIVLFRWVAMASVVVGFSSFPFLPRSIFILPDFAFALMRSISILELCLLGFLCLSMRTLHLKIRDMAFGIALGFGLMSTSDFILASFWNRQNSMTAPLQFFCESMILLALGIWTRYAALPEPLHAPVVVPVNSAIYRWNEIAFALGHTGTQVAVRQPASGFFLTDVEEVVEKVLARNLKKSES